VFVHATGSATAGQTVFRYETFGNQGFWTDALKLPQGIAATNLTPLQALQIGLSINIDAVNAPTKTAIQTAISQITAGAAANTTAFGDPAVTLSLINQNAVIGVVAFNPDGSRKALANTGTLNIAGGDRVGVSCASCHAIASGSVLPANAALGTVGTIGVEIDGATPHKLDVGKIFAAGQNSLAYFPFLQAKFDSLSGATVGRGFAGLQTASGVIPTEAQVDAYLTGTNTAGDRFYPVGNFDDTFDGLGNPLHISPLFRTDPAAPWGSDGGIAMLDNFSNLVYSVALDPTVLLTPEGRTLLTTLAGVAGTELADDYERILRATGVLPAGPLGGPLTGIPFVTISTTGTPGSEPFPAGRRVDNTKLLDLNAYLNAQQSPAPPGDINAASAARGREIFRTTLASGGGGCTACHKVDQKTFVPTNVIPFATIYPGYAPTLILNRTAPLGPVSNSEGPSPLFDDKMIVVDATRRVPPDVKGNALPLLLDLSRKTTLLHTDEVRGATFNAAAEVLLNPSRGPQVAHPFYVADAARRADVIEYLRGQ
jgi:mono/diheme cytochrome c family protein